MIARTALGTACILGLFVALLGCQSTMEPEPAPQAAPLAITTATPLPTPTPPPTNTVAPPIASTSIVSAPTLRPTEPPATPAPTATPTPGPTEIAALMVQPTDGPIRVDAMPSRDHFPPQLKITDVIPGGYSTVPPTSGRHWGRGATAGFITTLCRTNCWCTTWNTGTSS